MKNLMIASCISLFVFFACSNNKENRSNEKNAKIEHYLNYDDKLDVKSKATVDTIKFRQIMNKMLPPKRIIELFGSGYQIFYLALDIETNGKTNCKITPEGASWTTGLAEIEKGLFNENIEVENDYAIIPQDYGDAKAVNIKDVFYIYNSKLASTFSSSPGLLAGKKVRSRKAFQIDITTKANGQIIKPWTITEIDISKFRPQLKTNLGREYYMGYFPAVLKDDFKSLKEKIVVPKEAIQRGISGKVFMKLFFEEDGKFAGYQLIKGLGYGCEEAVIKALSDYPLQSHPSGERSTLILPFHFGNSNNLEVDIMVKTFGYDETSKDNRFILTLFNRIKPIPNSRTRYSVYVYLDGKLVFRDINASEQINHPDGITYSFSEKNILSGIHYYSISIDPENVLNDVDRSNNIVRGKLVIK